MVSTVSPKASATPKSPIPTCGKPAAITAEPHPPKVSQNVPIASAAYFLVCSMFHPFFLNLASRRNYNIARHYLPKLRSNVYRPVAECGGGQRGRGALIRAPYRPAVSCDHVETLLLARPLRTAASRAAWPGN